MGMNICKNCKHWRYSEIRDGNVVGRCSSNGYYEEQWLRLNHKEPDRLGFLESQSILVMIGTPEEHTCSHFHIWDSLE